MSHHKNTPPKEKPPYRRKCIFCDKNANSREHVIPEWLSKRMQIRDFGFHPAHYSEVEGLVARPAIKSQHFKTRIVCSDCNNGWMSTLENWMKSTMGKAVEPNWAPTDLQEINAVRDEVQLLIRWLLKTAIAFERAAPQGVLEKINSNLHSVAGGNLPANDCHVWTGYIIDSAFLAHLKRGFPVWNGGKLSYQQHAKSCDFALQLNHLGLRLIHCPDATAGLKLATLREDGKYSAPLSLTVSAEYPFPFTHDFPTFSSFFDVLEVHAKPPMQS